MADTVRVSPAGLPNLYRLLYMVAHDCGATSRLDVVSHFDVPAVHAGFLDWMEQVVTGVPAAKLETFAIGEQAEQSAVLAEYPELAAVDGLIKDFLEGL